ncbi:YheU family protein [Legionella feeleii]|uniref:YheU family protein n=1 Tax=Legionella feeleii TaxID=453 RepID=UPI0010418C3E|nr:YheU family protein [Legionella feeleii]
MIEIDYHLLSEFAVENLIMTLLTREATDYGEEEMDFAQKKQQLLTRLEQGDAVIIYSAEQGYCTIVPVEEKQKWLSQEKAIA